MIETGKDCTAVVVQMKAVKSGLNSVMDKYIMANMDKCMKKGKVREMEKLISELTKNN